MNNNQENSPLASVILPVYNAEKYLDAAIQSTICQTYKNIEIICVDDISTDTSLAILHRYAKEDKRITVLQLPRHSGAATAANWAIKHAKGKFIARMDADDIMLPDRFEKQVKFLIDNPDVVGCGGQCMRIDENSTPMGVKSFPQSHEAIHEMIFHAMPLQQPTLMVNKEKLPKDFVWYNQNLHIVEDFDLFYRLMKIGKLANLPEVILQYREHRNNQTLTSPKRTFWLIWKTRIIALTQYGYIPSIAAIINVVAQTVFVLLLPDRIIYPLHIKTRTLFFKSS